MVTAAASERACGRLPTARAGAPSPGPVTENDWTPGTLAAEPPPNSRARSPDTATAASCSGARSEPSGRAAPVRVRMAYTPLSEAPLPVSPPSTTSRPGAPGTTTSRLSGWGRCQGSRPDSAAGRPAGAAAFRAAAPAGWCWPAWPAVPDPRPGLTRYQAPAPRTATPASAATSAAVRRRRAWAGSRRPGARWECGEGGTFR